MSGCLLPRSRSRSNLKAFRQRQGFCHGPSMLEHRPRGARHLVTSELIRLGQNGEAMSDGAFLDADSLCACCSCLVWTCLDCGENPNPLVFIKIGHRMEVSPFGHAHQAPEIVVPPREPREPQSEEPWWTNAKLPGEPRRSP